MKSTLMLAGGALFAVIGAPALAQDGEAAGPPDREDSVYSGDWITVGAGAVYSTSYDGSDDYVVFPIPMIMGKVGPVSIAPRAGGVALDFIENPDRGVGIDLGLVVGLNSNRASKIEDPVVKAAGELDRAVEIGPSAGLSFPGVLNPYDRLSVGVDARWDVAGAHEGMVMSPSVSYFTPLSRGMISVLSLSAEYGDDDYADYYYSVSPAQSAASGLPLYQADSGFNKAGATMLLGVDLDGNLANGGLAVYGLGGYSRMLGDAKRTPYTSVRGDADQWFAALGVGYTF
ncbi:MipA/OmpV family protein [Pelagerythrobacter marensis]|uniref:Structural protein MipA n=1 Tax=Pelagerythrobacter marensis TaxID=543877 RepID=A0A0G3X6L8_9SPHN|nr:MipA/OmpV family protein [Pelagerythrobacter marensis]AKM06249.1 structural protein MipA [Pelagerythrobacter marensis]